MAINCCSLNYAKNSVKIWEIIWREKVSYFKKRGKVTWWLARLASRSSASFCFSSCSLPALHRSRADLTGGFIDCQIQRARQGRPYSTVSTFVHDNSKLFFGPSSKFLSSTGRRVEGQLGFYWSLVIRVFRFDPKNINGKSQIPSRLILLTLMSTFM